MSMGHLSLLVMIQRVTKSSNYTAAVILELFDSTAESWDLVMDKH